MDLQVTFRAEGRPIGSVDNWPLARPIHWASGDTAPAAAKRFGV